MPEPHSPARLKLGAAHERPRSRPFLEQPPALTLSAAWHAVAVTGCALDPAAWPWWLAGTFANHAIVTAAGLWPRSSILGPNWTRLPAAASKRRAIALTIDDGPDPQVTPQVLDLLDRHGVRATFFCIGEHARRYPALTREIVARGHAVENHSQRHRHTFSVSGPGVLAREIEAAQQTLADLTGEWPRFFRAPAGLRNVFLEPVLQRFDLRLASWTRRGFDTRETRADVVAQRLVHQLAAGDILLAHDGNAANGVDGLPVILSTLPQVFVAAQSEQLHFITLREALLAA